MFDLLLYTFLASSKSWLTPIAGRGSSLALRNISNIPFAKSLSRAPCVSSQELHQTGKRFCYSYITLVWLSFSTCGELGGCVKLENENLASKLAEHVFRGLVNI